MATITPHRTVSEPRDLRSALSVVGSVLVVALAGATFALLVNKVVTFVSAAVSGI